MIRAGTGAPSSKHESVIPMPGKGSDKLREESLFDFTFNAKKNVVIPNDVRNLSSISANPGVQGRELPYREVVKGNCPIEKLVKAGPRSRCSCYFPDSSLTSPKP